MRTTLNVLMIIILASVVGQAIAAEPPPTETTGQAVTKPTYKGGTFEEWVAEYQAELDPEKRIVPLKALIVFGANGKAKEVMSIVVELLDGYPPTVIDHLRILKEEDEEKYYEILNGSTLPTSLEGFFEDIDDLKLYRTARLGFFRLSHLTVPQLVELIETPSERPTARLLALFGLAHWSDSKLSRLIPLLVSRRDDLSETAWQVWSDEMDSRLYTETAQKLLELKEQPQVLRAVQGIKDKQRSNPGVGLPLLLKLQESTTDTVVREAAKSTLEQIQKTKDATVNAKSAENLPTY